MALLWPKAELPHLENDLIVLRLPKNSDFQSWHDARINSRAELEPFEPKWSVTDHTRRIFRQRVKRCQKQSRAGTDYSFLILLKSDPKRPVVGGVTLSSIKYAVARHGTLGYWTSTAYSGQGLMTSAVAEVIRFAFETLTLNRIHAAFLPHNIASKRVLEKNHFVEEGFSQQYLRINGDWQDHIICGLTYTNWQTKVQLAHKKRV